MWLRLLFDTNATLQGDGDAFLEVGVAFGVEGDAFESEGDAFETERVSLEEEGSVAFI